MSEETIRVLNAGCQIFDGMKPDLIRTLVGFMELDPRIELAPEERRQMLSWRNEGSARVTYLNQHLKGFTQTPVDLKTKHQEFSFYVPNNGKIVEVQLEAFALNGIDSETLNQMTEKITKGFDVTGICRFCAIEIDETHQWLELSKYPIDYDAGTNITAEKIMALAGIK